jgi:hypothetical protein
MRMTMERRLILRGFRKIFHDALPYVSDCDCDFATRAAFEPYQKKNVTWILGSFTLRLEARSPPP